jgi:short subunit dehydrogenase-like uncharacterized protein
MTNSNNAPKGKLLIYGATGYTGTLIAKEAARRGLDFEIAGRSEDKLATLAAELNVPYHVFSVDDLKGWETSLKGKAALLNIAGPFSETANQAMKAAIEFKVHYIDITAEVDIYRLAETKDAAAQAAGIMILSGAGLFATYDPLVVHTAKRVKNPVSLRVAFKYSGRFTPGSVASASNIINAGILMRKNESIEKFPDAKPAAFDFGNGPEEAFPMPLGGVVISYKSTGIPDIEEYFLMAQAVIEPSEGNLIRTNIHKSEELSVIIAEVTGADGTIARTMAEMPGGYIPTVASAIEIVSRVLKGEYKEGFQTPGSAYGEELLETLPNVMITD